MLREFELMAISLLVSEDFVSGEALASAQFVSLEHTGYGYFLTVKHPSFPSAPRTCHQPLVTGRDGSLLVGFVVYLGHGELMLECHALDGPVPADVRDRALHVTSS